MAVWDRQREKKEAVTLENLLVVWPSNVQDPDVGPTKNFWYVRNSSDRPTAVWEQRMSPWNAARWSSWKCPVSVLSFRLNSNSFGQMWKLWSHLSVNYIICTDVLLDELWSRSFFFFFMWQSSELHVTPPHPHPHATSRWTHKFWPVSWVYVVCSDAFWFSGINQVGNS